MQAILFAIISYLGWGTGDIFGTIATRKIGPYPTTLWFQIFSLVLYIPLSLLFLDSLKNLSINLLTLNVFLGVLGAIGLVAFYEGLRIGNASLVGTISASFVAVTVILSIIFLGESITITQAILIFVIFTGIIISTLDFSDLRNAKNLINEGILMAVIAMMLWGVYWAFIKIPVQELGWFWPGLISVATFPIILIFMMYRKIKLVKPSTRGAFLPLVANAALLGVASFSFNFAISKGLTSIVAPIAGSYPTLFAFLASLIFKDPITRQQVIGILVTLIGVVLLSIFST